MARTRSSEVNYDVRIMTYDTNKGKVANVTFHEGLGQLIGDNIYIKLMIVPKYPNRLYFKPLESCDGDGSAKLSNGKIQYGRKVPVDICNKFIGEYQLQFDDMGEKLYYINGDKATKPNIKYGNFKVPHPNHQKGAQKKVTPQTPKAVVKKVTVKIPKVDVVEVETAKASDSVAEMPKMPINTEDRADRISNIDAVIELLNVLDTYDTNKMVYKAGHTLIQTIKEMMRDE